MKKTNIIHIILIVLGTIFVSLSIFHSNICFDEAYSIGIANKGFSDIWKIGGSDVHPVLYYWILKIISIIISDNIIIYRIVSVIPIILLGILGYTHIKKDFGYKTGILFSFFSYFIPMVTVYVGQIRMYSWAIYFVTILAIYSYRIIIKNNYVLNWSMFALFSILSIYIHYYGLITVVIINIFLFINFMKNKKYKKVLIQIIIGVIQIILYLPWILFLLKQINHISNGYWIGFEFPKTLFELIGCQMTGRLNEIIGFCINIFLSIFLGIIYFKNRKKENIKISIIAISIYFLVVIFVLLISIVLNNLILYYRYLFVITGFYIFSISNILSKVKNKYVVFLICGIVLIISIYNNILLIKENYNTNNGKQIEYLKNNIQQGDIIVYKDIMNGSIYATLFKDNKQFFYNSENWNIEEAYKVWSPQMEVYNNTDFLNKCNERIWIIDTIDNILYLELFNNSKYNFISKQNFCTSYKDYKFSIILVKKNH